MTGSTAAPRSKRLRTSPAPVTKAERRARAAARLMAGGKGADRAAKTRSRRIKALAAVIVGSFRDRGEVTVQDGIAAGFPETEFRRLYDRALECAKRVEPRLAKAVPHE